MTTMKLANFLFSGPGGRERSDPDTVIADDLLPTRSIDSIAPDTVADPMLMASAASPAHPAQPRAQARGAAERPSLVLMDVVMPGQSGYQVTRALSRDPETQTIPVVICTSKSNETDRIWGLRQGARDYLIKPIRADELLSKIADLVA